MRYREDETRTFKSILIKLTERWPLTREQTLRVFEAERILARAYYNPPLHTKKTSYATRFGAMPMAERLTELFVLMPSGEFVSIDDIAQIIALMQQMCEWAREIDFRLKQK